MFNIFADTMMTATRNKDWPAAGRKDDPRTRSRAGHKAERATLRRWLRGTGIL